MTMRTGLFMGVTGVALLSSQAMALVVADGNNNLTGDAVGLQENYVRPTNTEYYAPSETGTFPSPTVGVGPGPQMPGAFESIRLGGGGTPIGINVGQPGRLNTASDIRTGTPNTFIPAYAGQPMWGARNGAIAEFNNNSAVGPIPAGTVTAVVNGLTPSFTSAIGGADDGLAPGSVAGDTIVDFAPFILNGGRTAIVTVSFFDAVTDPSGTGAFTPHVRLYEGGAPLDLTPANIGGLDEDDFNHNTGELVGTLAAGDDGTLLLDGIITSAPTGILTFNLQPDGSILLDIAISGGTVTYTGGSLVDSGQVQAGSTGSFGASFQQLLFTVLPPGVDEGEDDAIDQFDFLYLRPGSSASGNLSLNVDEQGVIPEPVTAGLGGMALASLGAYLTRRRRA